MIIIPTSMTIIGIFGNIIIAQSKKDDFRDWIPLSILIGPLSWPIHWHLTKFDF